MGRAWTGSLRKDFSKLFQTNIWRVICVVFLVDARYINVEFNRLGNL
jgi:hypothetical protein